MKVADPNSEPLPTADGTEKAARRRGKPRSVSLTSLSAMLEAEADPVKRELLQLVLDWLSARTQEKRGGFLGSGEISHSNICPIRDLSIVRDYEEIQQDTNTLADLILRR